MGSFGKVLKNIHLISNLIQHQMYLLGMYNNVPVAVKITVDSGSMENEMAVYNALNANDPATESNRIPRIYYAGTVLSEFAGIAMSLFQGTLNDRYLTYKHQNRHLPNFSILMIFKQAVRKLNFKLVYFLKQISLLMELKVEALEFIHRKKVLHNDIKPGNIFFRNKEVFIGGKLNISTNIFSAFGFVILDIYKYTIYL